MGILRLAKYPLVASPQVYKTNLLTALFPLYLGHLDWLGAFLQLCARVCFIKKLVISFPVHVSWEPDKNQDGGGGLPDSGLLLVTLLEPHYGKKTNELSGQPNTVIPF